MTTWLFEPTTDGAAHPDALDITLRFDGAVTVCVLDGLLCASTAHALDGWLDQLTEQRPPPGDVDLHQVSALSTDGVDVLVHDAEELRRGRRGPPGPERVPGGEGVCSAHCDAEELVEADSER